MKTVFIIGVVALITLAVILGPLVLIWSLNTLFPVLAIGYTTKTWLAAFLFVGTLRGFMYRSSDD